MTARIFFSPPIASKYRSSTSRAEILSVIGWDNEGRATRWAVLS